MRTAWSRITQAQPGSADALRSVEAQSGLKLPDDLAEAFDSMKLAILHHKRDAWQQISAGDVLHTLDALKALVLAPSDDAPF